MVTAGRLAPVSVARAYFALQAVGGAVWWIAVAASDDVRTWTLGQWDPAVLVWPDLAFFVGASAITALSASRTSAVIAAVWTTGVTVALGIYGLAEQQAGWGVVLMALATLGTLAGGDRLVRVPADRLVLLARSFREAEEALDGHCAGVWQLVLFWTAFFVIVSLVLSVVEQLHWSALDQPGVLGREAAFVVGKRSGCGHA
jgi:hypothetical protein